MPPEIREAGRLTVHAVETRYPGIEEVTEAEFREALGLAERVVHWAEQLIESESQT